MSDPLSRYRAKRSADRSPEPVGTVSTTPGRLFVVHKHAARQLHWDLRMEMDGVLASWAVPKGPSYDQGEKRLAVHVEDHPLDYADFEGVIPAGNYGAGGMIVWDRGEWVAVEDWRAGLEKGKLLFDLHGHKLRGRWTLVKIKKAEKEWLLIKERDAWMTPKGTPDSFSEASVLSGLTVEEIAAGRSPAGALRAALEKTAAPRTRVDPRSVEVMLAEPSDRAFTRDGWMFEPKLDGYRLLACKHGGEPLLLTRKGNDYTAVFPEVARALRALPLDNIIIDGEVVVMDGQGRPSFSRLQQRGRLSSHPEIARATVELPAVFFTFDLIAFEDFDLRPLPLRERKPLLQSALPRLGIIRTLDHVERDGELLMEHIAKLGLEGIIAKKADASYRRGRSDCWLKIKTDPTADFVIVGFTAPKGRRPHFGALQLGDMVGGQLVYAGRVGTGFDDTSLAELAKAMQPIVRETAPCVGVVMASGTEPLPAESIPETRTTTWVEPKLVCEVRFREWTPDGVLRHATFIRLRTDKAPRDCDRQGMERRPSTAEPERTEESSEPTSDLRDPTSENHPARDADSARKTPSVTDAPRQPVPFTNLKKVYWPSDGYTKGDLIEYYRAVSRWILPYLRNRPLVMTRYPDGIDGKSFYQKDAPEFAPSWLRTVPIWSEDTQRDINYFVCDTEDALLYVANLGSIPLHMWASRVGTLEQPDWCVVDLDPKEAPFSDVIRVAQAVHALCARIDLPHYVKTTGKTGLHILIPLGRQCTYEQSRMLGELLARVILADLKDIATITRHVTKRGDKVYFDYLQNRHGQTIVAPFSVRPLPGATVSMPLTWDEVNDSLDPKTFTIRTAIERMERLGSDPNAPVLEEKPDLAGILRRLAG